jgi:hypothetical protein
MEKKEEVTGNKKLPVTSLCNSISSFVNERKKEVTCNKKSVPRGAVTGHYLVFLEETMNEMNCLPEMKAIT